ncbi:MAG: ABC transporter ATP-binding protein [Deltaproteobacteria bacterium]|nr:ABC transporter ATP-binding protein [Deltaproteobacteria bacterium]
MKERAPALLQTESLGMQFGGLRAVDGVGLRVGQGEVVGLIGPNGAGKTTCFNMITGVYKPTTGSISLGGERIDGLNMIDINRRGIARTFQNIRLFRKMSVLDNVRVALHHQVDYGLVSSLLRLPSFKRAEASLKRRALDLLSVFGLADRSQDLAGDLPYGEQRKLEIVRALATGPKLLLLDEPAAGMNPHETENLTLLMRRLGAEFGVSILLIEHDMSLVMKICEHIYVLDYGREIAQGEPSAIQNNQQVIKAYLGEA